MDNAFETLWNEQLRFTKKFWDTKGGLPDLKNEIGITAVAKDYILHLIKEATEILDELACWKMHRASKGEVIRGNELEEIVDTLKYTLGLAQVLGFTFEELETAFMQKSMVVNQRFDQERSLPQLRDEPCVLVDVDGVLSDYPRCFHAWVVDNGFDARLTVSDLLYRENVKKAYRESGAKANQPVLPGAHDLLDAIWEEKAKIILLTMRPYAQHYRIYPDTLLWLKKNGLQYDAILWAKDKGLDALKNFTRILLAIDDDDSNLHLYKKAGIPAVKVTPPDGTAALAKIVRSMLREGARS